MQNILTKNSNEYIMYISSDPWVLKVQRRTTKKVLLTSPKKRLRVALEDILIGSAPGATDKQAIGGFSLSASLLGSIWWY